MIMENARKFVCPYCNSDDVIEIVYGLPADETVETAKRGEILLGGCVIEEGSPNLYCKSCDHNWFDESIRR
ncbi:MAG: hypothetical protein ACHQ6U_11270 [Thermodesulfobacteriota bacterium]